MQIDGAFGDWSNRTVVDKDDSAQGNPNIDMAEYGNSSSASQATFYISVEGDACCGSFVPVVRGKPTSGGGGTVVPVRRTAEDITRIYVDVDRSTSSGRLLTFGSTVIGAERLIEVRGLHGNIVSSRAFTYTGTAWEPTAYTVVAANDHKRLEVGIETGAFGWVSEIDFVIETTDWRSRTDWSDPDPFATAGVKTWLVDSATTSATATDSSVQRKLFYDGTNIWSFYFDGTNTVCRYSTDLGQTWNAPTDAQPFVGSGVDKVSVWYVSSSNIVYAIGDTANPSQNAAVQRGVVSPASHSITWAASDGGAPVSATNRGTKNTFISADTSGYLWAMGTSRVNSNNYNLVVVRGNAPGDFRNWTSTGTVLAAGVSQSTIKGSVLPTGTGSDVWAVYVYNGDVAARKYCIGCLGGRDSHLRQHRHHHHGPRAAVGGCGLEGRLACGLR